MFAGEIRKRLESLGYHVVDGEYSGISLGLILRSKQDRYVLADIRESEGKVVLPKYNNARPEDVTRLKRILSREGIPLRDKKAGY